MSDRLVWQKDSDVITHLKTLFKNEMAFSRANGHFVIGLELYAGCKRVSRAVRRLGFGMLGFEVLDGPQFDLLNPAVAQLVDSWIAGGCVGFVFLGTPCSSWYLVRRGPLGSSWGPIRSARCIYGLPGLSPGDRAKVLLGNRTMRQSARTIRRCVECSVPALLENPVSSRLLSAPPIRALTRLGCCERRVLDQCQYKCPWRKRTVILGWHAPGSLGKLNRMCTGRKGLCSATGKHHIVLSGRNPATNELWTSQAQAYSPSFANEIAKLLVQSHSEMGLYAYGMRGRG